jgi:gas vesicle protein
MRKFEDNIRKNRGLFDDQEPPPGHFARFEEKLERTETAKKKRISFTLSLTWRIAASILVLITLSVIYNNIDHLAFTSSTANQELPDELLIASNYYANLNHEKINRINELAADNPEANEIAELAKQEAETIDKTSSELKEKYKETKDDRVINAIITNYRVLGELLDHIIQRVNETQ